MLSDLVYLLLSLLRQVRHGRLADWSFLLVIGDMEETLGAEWMKTFGRMVGWVIGFMVE